MPLNLTVGITSPKIPESTFLAQNATIVGDVVLGEHCSIWFQAVVRGDVNKIIIGDKVNIQDGAIIHCSYQKAATLIGNNVSIGHRAIVHGCKIEDDVLIGMGAIVMDNVIVGTGSIVAAGAVVLENIKIPPYTIYAGVPAREVKKMNPEEAKEVIRKTADNYVLYKTWFE